MHALSGWASVAAKSLAGAASGTLLTAGLSSSLFGTTSGLLPGALPLKLGSFDPSFLSSFIMQGDFGRSIEHVGLFSLTAAVMFIGSIRGLNKHSTAKQGNWFGILATALGIISVMISPAFAGSHIRFFTAFI